jgi:hypothetical protein
MSGAIFFHLTTELGTVVSWNEYESDNGLLFVMAITALILSMIMLLNYYSKNLPLNSLRKIIGFKNE